MRSENNIGNEQSDSKKSTKTPESASEITAEWLRKEVLKNEPSASKLVAIETDSDFGSWSLLGNIARVKLEYATERCEPKSVIVKFQGNLSNPEREGEIYRLLAEAKVKSVPRLYGMFDNGTLALEDMSPAKPLSKTENLTVAQASDVISTLADIHGKFFGDSRVPKNPTSQFANVINHNMKESWDIFENRYREQLGEVADDFKWMRKNAKTVSAQHNSDPTTLNHADVHPENLLFNPGGHSSPTLIDWQLAGQKVLPFDITGLLVGLTVEQRREHEDMLLNKYYKLLPSQVQANYKFDRLLLDYRACVTRGMLGAVMTVGPRFASRPDQFKHADVRADRVIAAVKDLKPVDAIKELRKHNL